MTLFDVPLFTVLAAAVIGVVVILFAFRSKEKTEQKTYTQMWQELRHYGYEHGRMTAKDSKELGETFCLLCNNRMYGEVWTHYIDPDDFTRLAVCECGECFEF